jgi:photosystem II stability/assembly factor-like uncharacterized protein
MNGGTIVKNFIPMAQGGIYRRPGTIFHKNAESDTYGRLIAMPYSDTVTHIIEMGNTRFKVIGVNTTSPTGTFEHPYDDTNSDYEEVYEIQNNDMLFTCHHDYPPGAIVRHSLTHFQHHQLNMLDGPYLDVNTSLTTIDPGAVEGPEGVIEQLANSSTYVLAMSKPGSPLSGIWKRTIGGYEWDKVSPGTAELFTSVEYLTASSLFVAMCYNSNVFTSSDGTTWTTRATDIPIGYGKRAIAQIANSTNRYTMICGDAGRLYGTDTSTSWTSWTTITTSITDNLNAVAAVYSSGQKWVVVGDAGKVLTLTSCVGTVTSRTSNTTENLNDVMYVSDFNAFFAVGDNGIIIKSTDYGATWSTIASGVTANLNKLAWESSNSRLWIFGDGGVMIESITGTSFALYKYAGLFLDINDAIISTNRWYLACSDSWMMVGFDGVNSLEYMGNRSCVIVANYPLFKSTDEGRLIRIKQTVSTVVHWGWGKIVDVVDSKNAIIAVVRDFGGGTTATADWRLGAWCDELGYPRAMCFYQQRAWYISSVGQPLNVWASAIGDYYNMAGTLDDGTTNDSLGFTGLIVSDSVTTLDWIYPGRRLIIGSERGEFTITGGSDANSPINATTASINRDSQYGAANVRPMMLGPVLLFVQRLGRKLLEYIYKIEMDGFEGTDLTILSEHLTFGKIKKIVYQQEPDQIVWCLLETGKLIGLTYQRKNDVLAWHQHQLGGTNPVIEDIVVTKDVASRQDQLWLLVKRTIGGATQQFVEYMPYAWNYGFGDVLADFSGVDAGVFDTIPGGGVTITGLNHLNGEVVDIRADTTVYTKTVTTNAITVDATAVEFNIGLPFTAEFCSMNLEPSSQAGVMQAVNKRLTKLFLRVLESIGGEFSFDGTDWYDIDDLSVITTTPYSMDCEIDYPGDYDKEQYIRVRQSDPLPFTLLAVMVELEPYPP